MRRSERPPTIARSRRTRAAARTAAAGILLASGLAALPATLAAAEIEGQVSLDRGGRAAEQELTRVWVWWQPDEPTTVRPPSEPFVVQTRQKEFEPRVTVVPAGSVVAFPNSDPILHNVFSVSEPARFDLGLYGQGPGKQVTFDQAGVVRVFCNVHQDMVAYVVVLDTPHSTAVGRDGGFALSGLPEGTGRLTVWHDQAEPWSRRFRISDAGNRPVSIELDLDRPRVPPHRNKLDRRYGRSSRDRYRGRP
jgi:plastocyanin